MEKYTGRIETIVETFLQLVQRRLRPAWDPLANSPRITRDNLGQLASTSGQSGTHSAINIWLKYQQFWEYEDQSETTLDVQRGIKE